MANSITITGGKGDFGLKSYIPQIYSPKLREKFWYNTILRKITNTEYKGSFKNKGDTIIVRCMPNIGTSRFVDGMKIKYEKPEAYDVRFTIDKGLLYAFVVSDVQKAFSDIPGWAEKWTDDGAKKLAQDWERWFFKDITSGTKFDVANIGNSTAGEIGMAGKISMSYNIGTSTFPVALYKTDAATGSSDTIGTAQNNVADKTSAVDLASRVAAVLEEQPSGVSGAPFMVVPVWMTQLLQTSEVFQSADKMGDDVSILRKNAVNSIGKLAGMDVYVSNLLPSMLLGNTQRKVWPIFFGDTSAITFADEVSITEVLRDKSVVGDFHRSISIGDWFVRYPERGGVAYVVKGV